MRRFSAFFLLLFFFYVAQANNKTAAQANTITRSSVTPPQSKLSTQTDIDFGLRYDSYFQSADNLPASETSFQMQLKYDSQDSTQSKKMHIIFGGYLKNNSTYIAAPEIYFQPHHQMSPATAAKVTYGRRIFNDSMIDQEFNLGLINPFLTQDRLHYIDQGLMGLHVEMEQKFWSLRLAYLPLYLPNQGPSVKEEDGKIVTANRWALRPPTQFAFNNQNKAIVYSITDYKVQDILFKDGVSLSTRLGPEKDFPYIVLSYSRKPINEIVLARETYANLNIVGQVFLSPVVLYTKNFTADLRYENQNTQWFISYIQDYPENQTAPTYYSIQNLQGIEGIAAGAHFDMQELLNWPLQWGLVAAKITGGEIQDINDDGSQNLFTFTKSRILFRQPVIASLNAALNRSGSFSSQIKWLYDLEQKGSILSTLIAFHPVKTFNVMLGIDILGTEADANSAQNGGDFLQQYQANDRVYGGMQYVF